MKKEKYLTKILYRFHVPNWHDVIVYLDLEDMIIECELTDRGMVPDTIVKNGKSGFKPIRCQRENHKDKVVYSNSIKIGEYDFKRLRPLCVAKDFDDYRNADIYNCICGYYDEGVSVTFEAYSDSNLPYIKWNDIRYFHSEDNLWPYEKLWQYIYKIIKW